jgi:hypothetical protein
MAIGYNATAGGNHSIAIGDTATASADDTIVIGYDASASGAHAVAIGQNAVSNNNGGVVVGYGANIQSVGNQSVAIGYNATVGGSSGGAVVVGPGLSDNGANSTTIGNATYNMGISSSGEVFIPTDGTHLLKTTAAITSGAGSSAGTLTNAPAAGNPAVWIPITINGTTYYIPAWS